MSVEHTNITADGIFRLIDNLISSSNTQNVQKIHTHTHMCIFIYIHIHACRYIQRGLQYRGTLIYTQTYIHKYMHVYAYEIYGYICT
jgi:hypothetical protein